MKPTEPVSTPEQPDGQEWPETPARLKGELEQMRFVCATRSALGDKNAIVSDAAIWQKAVEVGPIRPNVLAARLKTDLMATTHEYAVPVAEQVSAPAEPTEEQPILEHLAEHGYSLVHISLIEAARAALAESPVAAEQVFADRPENKCPRCNSGACAVVLRSDPDAISGEGEVRCGRCNTKIRDWDAG